MPVINANHTGATKTTMFGQPAYPGYPGNNEGVAHSQPPSQEAAPQPQEATFNTPSSASNSGSTQVYRQAATGENQVPGWIASLLKSGAVSSWTNSVGQTFVNSNNGIHAVGSSAPAQITTSKTFAFGGTPATSSSPSTPSVASPSGASTAAKASGSGIPLVDYHTFGTNADISFPDSHSPNFTVKVTLPNGQTFTYSGSTEGVALGTINAKDQAVDQAWNAYLNAQSSLQNVPAGSSLTVTQGNNGLNLDINAAPGTSLPTQKITIAPGLTMTEPTPTASAYAAANLLGTSGFVNSLDPGKTYTSNGITFTGSQLQNMYSNYTTQITTALAQQNPTVTFDGETADFNSLTPAQQQAYVEQQTDQYLQNLQYNGAGYYNINGKNTFISLLLRWG